MLTLNLLLALLFVGDRAVPGPKLSSATWIAAVQLSNDDVDWDGGFFGLHPFLSTRALLMEPFLRPRRDLLLRMARRQETFAIAHVLLVRRLEKLSYLGVSFPGGGTGADYHGLPVTLEASGAIIYESHARKSVARHWYTDEESLRRKNRLLQPVK